VPAVEQALDVAEQFSDRHRLGPLGGEGLCDPDRLREVGVQPLGELAPGGKCQP
jgi:hypothetical protein